MAHRASAAALAVASAAALAMSAGGFLCFVGPMSEQARSASLRAHARRAEAPAGTAPSASWSAGATAVAAAALAAGASLRLVNSRQGRAPTRTGQPLAGGSYVPVVPSASTDAATVMQANTRKWGPVFNYNESLLKSPPQPRKGDYSKDRRKALWLKYSLDTKMYGRKRNCRVKCKLKIACQTGDLRTVREMIESGSVDVNEPEIDGDQGAGATAVIEAAYGQHLEVVKYLISRRADLTIGTRDENATAYDYARDGVLAFLRDAEALARCRAEGDAWLADKEAERKAEERKAAKPYIEEATEELRAELTAAHASILAEMLWGDVRDAQGSCSVLQILQLQELGHRIAKQAVMYALKMRYRSRRVFKRTRRELWIKRVSNNSKLHGVRYNVFICRLKEKNININRKILSQLGVYDRAVFTNVLETAIPEWKQLKEEADNRGKKKEYTVKELDDIAVP
ncbi:rplT [Symbiodinium sp. CCMP2592]|nr:rplT [Symbiodinium sp. CCMP2592]